MGPGTGDGYRSEGWKEMYSQRCSALGDDWWWPFLMHFAASVLLVLLLAALSLTFTWP